MAGPDRGLSQLLKWGIENTPAGDGSGSNSGSVGAAGAGAGASPPAERSRLNPEILASLFGGPSDAELMQAAMGVVTSADPDVTLDDKLVAFDNLEQLIESLDNANNLASLALWPPLLGLLGHPERELRRMAAWCVGTAVQNNERSQERLLAEGGIPRLVGLALGDAEPADVRRKAVYALSSAVRNYQPAMDAAAAELTRRGRRTGQVDAADMDAVDVVINGLKEHAAAPGGTAPAA